MKLESVNLLELVPSYMQDDETVIGLCAAANYIFGTLYNNILKMDFIQGLNLLDEKALDYIATCRNIPWYNNNDSQSVKVEVLKNAEKVFWNLGTVSAVESVITDIFGEAEIAEWFNYNGEPYHFKIVTDNPQITGDAVEQFNSIIQYVKRKLATLDTVEISLSATMETYYGFAIHTGDYITLKQEG